MMRITRKDFRPEILAITPLLGAGWVAQSGWGAPYAMRKRTGEVTIVAVLNGLSASGTAAFTLPEDWVPSGVFGAPLSYWSGSARILGTLQITAQGACVLLGNADVLVARDSYIINATYLPAIALM